MRSLFLKGFIGLSLLLVPVLAMASDDNLGCTVALCMANPAGPTALAECRKPMQDLAKRLARGKSFPKCKLGGDGETDKKGDWIVFRLKGQPTRWYNIKTGQSREEPAYTGRPGNGGPEREGTGVNQQLR